MLQMRFTARRFRSLVVTNHRWRFALVLPLAGLLASDASGVFEPAPGAPQGASARDAAPGNPAALYEDMHRLGHKAIDLVAQSLAVNAPVVGAPARVTYWSGRLLASDLYRITSKGGHPTEDPEVYFQTASGAVNEDVAKALREHLDRMKAWEERFRPLATNRQILLLDFMDLQGRRLQAEIWLARELHKPTGK